MSVKETKSGTDVSKVNQLFPQLANFFEYVINSGQSMKDRLGSPANHPHVMHNHYVLGLRV